jgi:DNA-binding NarL/FixJ family response regulator
MKVVVADDHALVRDGISSLLEAAGFNVVAQANDGAEAVIAAASLQPDLVLMDISMPGMDGLEALRRIKDEHPQIKVVMLTVSEDDQDLFEALRAGAQGYLLKSMDASSFVMNLEQLNEGDMAVDPKVVNKIVGGYVELAQGNPAPSKEILTPREIELINLVAEGMPNKAIAQRLSVSENTVKYHIRQILNKLGVQNRTEAVTSAIRLGLINPP